MRPWSEGRSAEGASMEPSRQKFFKDDQRVRSMALDKFGIDTRHLESTKKPRKFFSKGRYFLCPWFEPEGDRVGTRFRRFIVIRSRHDHCLCLPVHTYQGRGTTKPGLNPNDHAPLIPYGTLFKPLSNERGLTKKPIHIVHEDPSIAMDTMARVNFAKVYTVEYSTMIRNIGRTHGGDLKRLEQYFNEILKVESTEEPEEISSRVVEWLSPPDPSINYNRALQQHHEGTGFWLLRNKAFLEWKRRPNSFLWLHGIPGCGKTILSATIIKDLRRTIPQSHSLLYFYFDFSDISKLLLDDMIRSLISQLYYRSETTRREVDLLFSSCEEGRQQPKSELLHEILLHSIEQADGTWIVLDALDECKTKKGIRGEGLLSWIRRLLDHEWANVHLLVTSRPEPDIRAALEDRVRKEDMISVQSDLVSDDIHTYIHARVREEDGLKRWRRRPEVQKEIETRLMEKADGMFRWAACQIDALEKCLDYRTLRNELESLPKTLDETYAKILRDIPSGHKQNTIRMLQFLAFSERPLRLEEAIDAIAVEPEGYPMFETFNRMPEPEEIVSYCSSLAILVSKEDAPSGQEIKELRLVHLSVKEYLTSNRLGNDICHHFEETTARAFIAKVCLAYLLHLDQKRLVGEIRKSFPFAQYCARYWMTHAIVGEGDELLQGLIMDFFQQRKGSYINCYQLYRPDEPWDEEPTREVANPPQALYYASLVGLNSSVHQLVGGADVNAQGGYYGNALQAASERGYDKIVRMLLDAGADVNAQGGHYGNALQAASERGYDKIVRMLLDAGADVNVQGGHYGNALQAASERGYDKIVRMLLDAGADVNVQGGHYGNALQTASERGYDKIVRMLLDAGADVNAQGGYYGNALQAASERGYDKIVRMLLNAGAGHPSQRTQLIPRVEPGSKRSYAEFSAHHSTSAEVSTIATPSILTIQEGEDHFIRSDTPLPYRHIKNLGHSHSAIVEMVEDVNTGSVFARKVSKIYGWHNERKSFFDNEIKIIRRLAPHHHVIRVFATYVTEKEVGLILHPVADSGDLEDFLHDFKRAKGAQPVQPEKTKILKSSFGCLVSGLAFMHRQKIRHKDIKPNNILIHEGSMIYTDFGYSLDHSAIGRSTTTGRPHNFTRKYCAPEVSEWGPRNSKSDVFSLGCVFLEILLALHEELVQPDPGKPYHDSLDELRLSLQNLNRLGMITSDMLHPRPEDRSSAEAITSKLRHYEAGLFCDICKAVMQHPRDEFAATTSQLPLYVSADESAEVSSKFATTSPNRTVERHGSFANGYRHKEACIQSC